MLVNGLPRDAAVWREETRWSARDEVQALTLERLEFWGRALYQAWGGKVRGESLHVPRPDEVIEQEARKKIVTDPAQIAGFFSRHLKGG